MKNEKKPKPLQIIGNSPLQPNISFMKTDFSGKLRNFQYKWFSDFSWLDYNEVEDRAYCFLCIKCIKEELSKKSFSKAKAFQKQKLSLMKVLITRIKVKKDLKCMQVLKNINKQIVKLRLKNLDQ